MGRMILYFMGVVLSFAAASYLGIFLWGVFGPNRPDVFRYRLTLNVSYNGKIYSGSSVIEGRQYLFYGYTSSGQSGVTNGFSY